MFNHILLPTDGSELSMRAVDMGIELAAKLDAKVFAFSVVASYPAFTYFLDIIQANQEGYMQEAVELAEGYLKQVEDRASAAGVPYHGGYVVEDHPYSAIVAAVIEHQCDLIVMASHGWKGMNRLLLGSETQKVLVSCDVPVLVCR